MGWGKPLALLAVLAVRGQAPREEIVDLLWRNVEESKARNAFRQALHRLRSAIGEELLPQERELLRLSRSAQLDVDLHRFEAAFSSGSADEAIQLYRGDFLQGVTLDEPAFDFWAEQERSRIRACYQGALERAIADAQASGRWTEAMAYGRRLLDVAPYDENAARTAALTLVSAGRRAEARDLIARFTARLTADLGLSVPPGIQSLLARLERQAETPAAAVAAPVMASAPALRFAGREAELTQLLSLWRSTGEDSGSIALIDGERGTGKSRLLDELVLNVRSLGRCTVLRGEERAAAAQIPFALWAGALRPLVHAPGIMGASRHLLAEAARLLPELRDSMDLPQQPEVNDEAARVRFFEGVAALMDAAAFEQPLLVVLDDLHFVGDSSLDLLSYVAARLAGSAVMFVLTMHPGDAPASVATRIRSLLQSRAAGGSAARALQLTLSPLPAAVLETALLGDARVAALTAAVRERIIARSDGIPGRVPELVRRALAGEEISLLPVSARALAEERLQRLSSTQRRAFLVLALLDRPVSSRTLSSAAHLTRQAAAEVLHVLEAEGLVRRTDDDCLVADAVAAEPALEFAGQPGRSFLAGWIAESLAADQGAHPGEVSRFFAIAGVGRDAYRYSRLAAIAAMRTGAWSEAVAHLRTARAFAGDDAEIAEAEGLLTGLGAGSRRLPPVLAPAPTVSGARAAEAGATQSVAGAQPSLWERWFPNWRMLLGAAVATLLVSALVLWRAPLAAPPPRPAATFTDTLVLVEGEPARAVRFVTGDPLSGFEISAPFGVLQSVPPWADSIARPWEGALPSPQGRHVAVSRADPGGTSVFAITADRRDTTLLARSAGSASALGWSPDGRWVLVGSTPADGGGARLHAFSVVAPDHVALDTLAHRAVVEAAWSPDGTRIAWVARVGAERQQEIFMSYADGGGAANVSRHPADDYHISWSGDGELLGFTSRRDGNAELYAYYPREKRLWRLTRDPAQDDRARFSRSGRLVAFESTRGGQAGIYVMPALGGEATRVGSGLALAVQEWRGGGAPYVERLRAHTARVPEPGDTVPLEVTGLDAAGAIIPATAVSARVLDPELANVLSDDSTQSLRLVGRRAGVARVLLNAGGWRFDTSLMRVGAAPISVVAGKPVAATWLALGGPRPAFNRDGAVLVAGRDGETGILSRTAAPLVPGFTVEALIHAQGDPGSRAASFGIALVAPTPAAGIDALQPQLLRYASLVWDADARRIVYSVGREIFTEPAPDPEPSLHVLLRVELDSTVSIHIGGRQRWRSTLRVITERSEPSVYAWLGVRGVGAVLVSDTRISLGDISSR